MTAVTGGWVHGQGWPLLSLPPHRSAHRSPTTLPPHSLPQHEGKYSDSEPGATYVYASSSFLDDLALAVSGGWCVQECARDGWLHAAAFTYH